MVAGERWAFSPERLREVRENRGWSRRQLSQHMGVRAEAVKNWETGTTGVTMVNLENLMATLDCEPSDLFVKREM